MSSSGQPDFDLGGRLIWDCCPDLVVVFAIASVLSLGRRPWRIVAKAIDDREAAEGAEAARLKLALFAWLVAFGTILATRNLFLPRYVTLAVPFAVILFAIGLPGRIGRVPVRSAVLAVLIVVNLANRNGRFFPSLDSDRLRHFSRTSAILERSHEYRRELDETRAAMKWLEDHAPDAAIVTHFPFGHFLSLPRLGYVTRPLHGYCLDLDTDYIPGFRELSGLVKDETSDLVFVATRPDFPYLFDRGPGDEILRADDETLPLVIYRKPPEQLAEYKRMVRLVLGNGRIDQAREKCEKGKIRHAWPLVEEARRLLPDSREAALVAALLADSVGDGPRTRVEIEKSLGGESLDAFWQPTELEDTDLAAAGELITRSLEAENDPSAKRRWHVLRGKLSIEQKNLDAAEADFARAIELDPVDPNGWFGRGVVLAARGELAEASASLEEAARLAPSFGLANFQLGILHFRSERFADAASAFARAAEVDPKNAAYRYHEGAARQRVGQGERAARAYRAALDLDPNLADAKNALAWLLATSADDRVRSPDEALRLASELCRQSERKVAAHLDTLAAAQAANGEFAAAVQTELEAVRLARGRPDAPIADYQARKERYQRGQAIRE